MKTFFSLALLALAQASLLGSSNADLQSEFLSWKASPAGQFAYENGYVPTSGAAARKLKETADALPTADELERFQNAKETIAKLQVEQPRAIFSLNTPFALLTETEFKAHVGKTPDASQQPQGRKLLEKLVSDDLFFNVTTASYSVRRNLKQQADVVDIDWEKKGCVNQPLDQGQCQASWALTSVGALESAHCINTGKLIKLSGQEVISCATNGERTCSKGVSVRAFDWVGRLNGGGVCTDESYPYASSSGVAPGCKRNQDASFGCNKVDVGAHFYESVNFRDHTQLEAAVSKQPVATLVNTGVQAFQFLSGGVIMGSETSCPSKQLDSSVLIVGYGTLDGVKYWKIRNNWSIYWGTGGYALIERGYTGSENGACGIETVGYSPVIVSGSSASINLRCSEVQKRVELLGATLKYTPGVKPQDCCDRCRRESGCKGYVWRYETDTCELKSSITGEQKNAVGASPTYSGTVMSRAERIGQGSIFNDIDFPGNDLFTTRTGSAEDCVDVCNEFVNCHAFSWNQYLGGSCYLKTKRPVTGTPVAKNADGSSFIRSGTSYKCSPLKSETDLSGGVDLASVQAKAAKDCCGICRATDKCAAFSWNDYNGGTCWLKQTGAWTVASPGVSSAFLN